MESNFKQLSKSQIEEIRERFEKIDSIEDFNNLLSWAIPNLFKKEHVSKINFDVNKYLHSNLPGQYSIFNIPKASGKQRVIYAPEPTLKTIQKLVNTILQCIFVAHPAAKGFASNLSVVSNARPHVKKKFVYTVDIEDFFHNILKDKVISSLKRPPFNLSDQKQSVAFHIADICCAKIIVSSKARWALPQGAPTSPFMSNIVSNSMDTKIYGLCRLFNITYSRYADDLTFSSERNYFQDASDFTNELSKIIIEEGFLLNRNKTRLQTDTRKQVVTGIIVNNKPNLSRYYIKDLRMYIYLWEKYGYNKAETYLNNDSESLNHKSLEYVISGRLSYLKMVRGANDQLYNKLYKRYSKLTVRGIKSGKNLIDKAIDDLDELSNEYFEHHRPQDVATFLRLFQDSPGLKYLTHEYDIPGKEFILEDILDLASRDFNKAYKSYFITRPLYARIKQFAFINKPKWWRYENGITRYKYSGWSSDEVKNWCFNNPGVHPIRLKNFRDSFITPFKESIQVKAPQLKVLIETSIQSKFAERFPELEVRFEGLESAEFYTDVDVILGGIRHLLDGIRERIHVSKKVKVRFTKEISGDATMKVLEIIHVDSKCHKDSVVSELMNGNFTEAERAFKGLCNWSIKSEFSNGFFKVDILSDQTNMSVVSVKSDEVEGFSHILSFY